MVKCKLAPSGWYCNIEQGHDGPCPAYPTKWTRTKFLLKHGETFFKRYGF